MSLKKYDDFDFSMEEEENPVNKKDAWKQIGQDRKIIGIEWVSAQQTIGVVAVENTKMEYWTAYMEPISDRGEKEDALHVAEYGAGLQEAVARAFFPKISKELKYKFAK